MLSMTGFGRCVRQEGGVALEIEVRSVNHRFLDLTIKTPRAYNQYDTEIRKVISDQLGRGRVEVFVTRRTTDAAAHSVSFNREMFTRLQQVYSEALGADVSAESKVTVALDILARREVLDISDDSASGGEGEKKLLLETLTLALTELQSMRSAEGQNLKSDLLKRLDSLKSLHARLEESVQKTPIDYRERLNQRLQRLAPDVVVDPSRLAAEVALMCDRIDTTEELVRLTSHFEQVAQALNGGSGSGRRLDFLIQEMGREFNTITSKAQDAAVQHLVIDAKAELERMKEQVQNVE